MALTAAVIIIGCVFRAESRKKQSESPPRTAPPARPELVDADCRANADRAAADFAAAMLQGRSAAAMDLLYPPAVAAAGGRDAAIKKIGQRTAEADAAGYRATRVVVDDVYQIVQTRDRLYAVIPYAYDYTTPGKPGKAREVLMGVSDDGGRKWTFIPAASPAAAKALVSDLPDEVVFPADLHPMVVATVTPPLPPDQRDRNLLGQARECSDAFNRKDWDKLANLTYEPVLKMVGGHDAMVKLLTRESRGPEAEAYPAGNVSIGDIKQIVTAQGKIYATVEQDMTMGTPAGDCYVAAWMLGVSGDGGRNWKFAAIADPVQMRKVLPELPPDLELLKQSKPQPLKPGVGPGGGK